MMKKWEEERKMKIHQSKVKQAKKVVNCKRDFTEF